MAEAELILRHRIDFGIQSFCECGWVQPTHCRRDILLSGPCSRDHRAEVDPKGGFMGGHNRWTSLFDHRCAVFARLELDVGFGWGRPSYISRLCLIRAELGHRDFASAMGAYPHFLIHWRSHPVSQRAGAN